MGAIVIRTRFAEGTESAEVAMSGTDCTGSGKFNYHTITATTAPFLNFVP